MTTEPPKPRVRIELTGNSRRDVEDAVQRLSFTGAKFSRVWPSRRTRGPEKGLWFANGTLEVA